ncbi:DUF4139 domain-containing protein [Candidatus Bipolaricaulota bacterium]|nr:DUF4139 domain-containing protein [Candidatus Bipolaricaulota bacterium]
MKNHKRCFLIPFVFGLVLIFTLGGLAEQGNSGAKKIITLYQSGPSLVIEKDQIMLAKGLNDITRSLPETVVTETVFTTSPGASLKSSRIVPAVNSQDRLLETLVGTNVSVVKAGSSETALEGTLVGIFNGKPLLKTSDGEMRLIDNPEEYRFRGFSPERKNARLELKLDAGEEVRTELAVGYQLSKLNWSPQYVGFLDEENETLDLRGVANIENRTGWNFQGVQLRLLAGEPKRDEGERNYFAAVRSLNQQEAPEPEQVFEYYRYKVGFPVDLTSAVETQVKFFHSDSVSYRKYYLFEPYSSSAVRTMLELKNTEEQGLGIPIASGTIRIYEGSDEKTFIGEDSLPNLPVERETELELGDAFDVKGERKRIDHDRIGERIWKDGIEITIENKKEKPIQLLIKERLPGDWEIIRSSHDYEKVNSRVIQYGEAVPAKGTVEISYLVQYEL